MIHGKLRPIRNYAKQAWGGHAALWKVFWLQLLFGDFILTFFGLGMAMLFFNTIEPWLDIFGKPYQMGIYLLSAILGFLYLVVYLVYDVVAIVSVWRCSHNSSKPLWGYAAKGVVVVNLALAVVECLFQ